MTRNPYRIEVDAPSGHLAITVDGDTAEAVRTSILLTLLEIDRVTQAAPFDAVHVDEVPVAPTTSDDAVATPDEDATQEPAFRLTRNNPDSELQRRIQRFLAREMPTTEHDAVTEAALTEKYNLAHPNHPVAVASIKVAVRHLMMGEKVKRTRNGVHGFSYWMPNAPRSWTPKATLVAGTGVVAGSVAS